MMYVDGADNTIELAPAMNPIKTCLPVPTAKLLTTTGIQDMEQRIGDV